MQKFITRIGFTRHAVKEFELEINNLLENGWHFVDVSVTKQGLRFLCQAVLEQDQAGE